MLPSRSIVRVEPCDTAVDLLNAIGRLRHREGATPQEVARSMSPDTFSEFTRSHHVLRASSIAKALKVVGGNRPMLPPRLDHSLPFVC